MTLDCHSRDRRFKSGRPRMERAEVAQSVEHGPEKAGVPSSILGLGTNLFAKREISFPLVTLSAKVSERYSPHRGEELQ